MKEHVELMLFSLDQAYKTLQTMVAFKDIVETGL